MKYIIYTHGGSPIVVKYECENEKELLKAIKFAVSESHPATKLTIEITP